MTVLQSLSFFQGPFIHSFRTRPSLRQTRHQVCSFPSPKFVLGPSVGKGRAEFIIHLNNSVELTRLDDDVSREAGMVRGKKGGREFVLSEADGGEFVTG